MEQGSYNMTVRGMHLYTNPHALQHRKPLLHAHHRQYKFHHDDITAIGAPTSMFDVQQFLEHMNSLASTCVDRSSRCPVQRCKLISLRCMIEAMASHRGHWRWKYMRSLKCDGHPSAMEFLELGGCVGLKGKYGNATTVMDDFIPL